MLAQLDAGAGAVQLFDTWAGELSAADYERFAMPYNRKIIERVRSAGGTIMLFFATAHTCSTAVTSGASGLALDWRMDVERVIESLAARAPLPAPHVIQGNLDPATLFAPTDEIRRQVHALHQRVGGRMAHIMNLGHGLHPNTPLEGIGAFRALGPGARLMLDALIVGGGVAGLEAALTLKANGLSVRLLEASERVGGAVSTRVRSGFRAELGASTVRADGALLQARCRDFDLPLQRVGAGSSRRKGVLTSAGLTYLAGPGDLMRSRLLGVKGKLRALAEPLQRAGTTPTSHCARFWSADSAPRRAAW